MSILKIAISSRALFDLNESHKVFKEKGLRSILNFKKHEDDLLKKGVAFPLVEKPPKNEFQEFRFC